MRDLYLQREHSGRTSRWVGESCACRRDTAQRQYARYNIYMCVSLQTRSFKCVNSHIEMKTLPLKIEHLAISFISVNIQTVSSV